MRANAARSEKGVVVLVFLLAVVVVIVIISVLPIGPPTANPGMYWGTRIVPAPAPATKGLPLIPVAVNNDLVEGVPAHLAWYAYNGREDADGLKESYGGNNTFYYAASEGRMQALEAQGLRPWWAASLGEPVRPSDFPGVWRGAPAAWRSPDASAENTIPVIVMQVDATNYPDEVAAMFAPDGFLAFAATDTDWGCTVWYESLAEEPKVAGKPPYSTIIDPCHDSMYDPRQVQEFPLPAGETAPYTITIT